MLKSVIILFLYLQMTWTCEDALANEIEEEVPWKHHEKCSFAFKQGCLIKAHVFIFESCCVRK